MSQWRDAKTPRQTRQRALSRIQTPFPVRLHLENRNAPPLEAKTGFDNSVNGDHGADMRISLYDLLAQKSILLADGATGTNFMNMGLEPGFPPDLWNTTEPEKPAELHQQFVDAGSDIILTNTFGANAPRLKLHKAEDETYAINKAGAELAGKIAADADRPVVVAGSVGPTGELFEPMGEMTMESAIAFFKTQMEGLRDGGADVIWIETMSAAEEIQAAAQAAIDCGMPYVFTASFDTAGKTMMGIAPGNIHGITKDLSQSPLAVGSNCGVGASDLLLSTLDMTAADPNAVVVGKANCGIPTVLGKETIYSGTPELMYDYAQLAADAGVRIIGGCCGNAPEHVAAMRASIDDYLARNEPGPRPTRESLEAALGPLVNPPLKAGAVGRRGASRRR
jgi:methionine synthase I (cobalamin-dependent)